MENRPIIKPWKCERCGYEWWSRNPNIKPKRCGRCKMIYWDRPARIPKPKRLPKKKMLKYPQLETLMIGDEVFIESEPLVYDGGDPFRRRRYMNGNIMRRSKTKGWKFVTTALPKGLLVKRIA